MTLPQEKAEFLFCPSYRNSPHPFIESFSSSLLLYQLRIKPVSTPISLFLQDKGRSPSFIQFTLQYFAAILSRFISKSKFTAWSKHDIASAQNETKLSPTIPRLPHTLSTTLSQKLKNLEQLQHTHTFGRNFLVAICTIDVSSCSFVLAV